MPTQRVRFGLEARQLLGRGFNRMADAMEVALGPSGRLVLIDQVVSTSRPPEPLRDGAAIARRFSGLPNRFENMGALLARHIAWQVKVEAGDGSTTAVIIARRVLNEATRCIMAGHEPVHIRRGLEKCLAVALSELEKLAHPLESPEQIVNLATSITGNDDLGGYIEEIFDTVGPHGMVDVRASYTRQHDRQYIRGAYWNQGWISSLLTTEGGKAVLKKPYILLTDHHLHQATELAPIMDNIRRNGQRGLVVIAQAIEGDALNILVTNKVRGVMPTLGLKAPGLGHEKREILQDLAVLCGGQVFEVEKGDRLETATLADLGQADEVQAIRSGFTLIGGKGRPAAIRERVRELNRLMSAAEAGRERDRLVERAGKLMGGVALLYVGGATDVERDHLKEQAKNAVRIVRLGLTNGVAPGGGAAFLACLPALDSLALPAEEAVAIPLMRAALLAPMQALIQNAGFEAPPLMAQIRQKGPGYGFDVKRGEITQMIAANIVDPVKVLRIALDTAISGAIMALTTEALVHRPRTTRDEKVDLKP